MWEQRERERGAKGGRRWEGGARAGSRNDGKGKGRGEWFCGTPGSLGDCAVRETGQEPMYSYLGAGTWRPSSGT